MQPTRSSDSDSEEPTSSIPLQHQRAFGAGLKRKRIEFVPQSRPETAVGITKPAKTPLGEVYLSIVLGKGQEDAAGEFRKGEQENNATATIQEAPATPPCANPPQPNSNQPLESKDTPTCPICAVPLFPQSDSSTDTLSVPHEATMHHQLSLPHSHPPSHIDRNRKGLSYLRAYGWDPDARQGLGATGEGRLFPVRAAVREGKSGVGVVGHSGGSEVAVTGHGGKKKSEEGRQEREERLRALVFGREDVNRYLGIKL